MQTSRSQLALSPDDIHLIEKSLRNQAALESRLNGAGDATEIRATAPKSEQIMDLINRIRFQQR
ncbi:MAG: hypothetical protein KTR18_14455 [Acidiferrobacterales bacterium]|nr:hypothetical protein [Acidiferrobacterales bacterium]